jgi:hypothetical protein
MRSLAELQRDFADALFAPEGREPAFAIDPVAAAERMDVYRRAVFANYRKALAATYPVVQRLVGVPLFDAAVVAYVRTHPSGSGDLNDYGDDFGLFLAGYPPAAGLPHLCDVARLEWAIDEVNRATDSATTPDRVLAALAAVPAERLPGLSLRLSPGCRLLRSDFPILSLWRANQPNREGDDGVPREAASEALLVRRDVDGIALERLTGAEFAWLATLAGGASFAAAIEAAMNRDPGFDLGRTLHAYVGNGTIVSIADR